MLKFSGPLLVKAASIILIATFFGSKSYAKGCDSFAKCRQDFIAAVEGINRDNKNKMTNQQLLVPSREVEPLTIQRTLVVAPQSERVVMISSGLHGVEGYVGTRMQIFLLKELWPLLNDGKTSLLLYHGLNPWGFKYNRRTSENNVDLNRNFSEDHQLYLKKNPEYMNLNDFLNPRKKALSGVLAGAEFLGYALRYIAEFGISSLRKAILVGQYQEKQGIFFGGQTTEPHLQLISADIDHVVKQVFNSAKSPQRFLAIDLHTGYGEKGKLHLMVDSNKEVNNSMLEKIFGPSSLDYGSQKDFYDVTGGFLSWLSKKLTSMSEISELGALTFEFGTLDSQSIPGALDSLYRMQKENQLYHYGGSSQSDAYVIQGFFAEMYNPLDEDWNTKAKNQFKSRINAVWTGL